MPSGPDMSQGDDLKEEKWDRTWGQSSCKMEVRDMRGDSAHPRQAGELDTDSE